MMFLCKHFHKHHETFKDVVKYVKALSTTFHHLLKSIAPTSESAVFLLRSF